MDEILGEAPFAPVGEFGSTAAVAEANEWAGEWAGEEPGFGREAASARLDEWQAELGEQPWSAEAGRSRPRSTARRQVVPGYRSRAPLGSGPPATTRITGVAPGAPAQGLGSAPTLATDPTACPDVTYRNQPWTLGKPGRHQSPEGTVTHERLAENAAVRTIDLGDFDVDDYRLRPAHRAILGGLVTAVAIGLRSGRIVAPVTVVVQGRTSSSGSMSHNLALSRHRAVNAAAMVRCLAKQAGIDSQLRVHWTPLGESVSQTLTGDSVEGADKRQVRILVIAPRPAGLVAPDPRPGIPGRAGGRRVIPVGRPPSPIRYPGRAPGRRITGPRSGTVTARICFEVVSVQRTGGFPWLPATGLGTAAARIRVHDDRTRSAALYELQGVVVSPRGSSDPGLAARLGPLARLAGMAQRLLGIAARAPVPAPACTPTSSVATGGSPLNLLGGLAVLVIPPAGSGRAALQLRPRSTRVRLRRRLVPVRAQRYRAPLIIVGQLLLVPVRNARAGQGEAEFAGLTEYGEWAGEDEFAPLGEAAGEWAELTEQSQNEFPALNEYGEFTELTEYGEWAGEDEFAPLGEWAGEWAELTEQSQNEFPALDEYGEFTELTEYGEWSGEDEFAEFSG